MNPKAEFEKAAADVQALTERPTNHELLELYSLYKQATEGDVKGSRPGLLDLKGRAKYDAWAAKKGMAAEEAMRAYTELVQVLRGKY